MAVIIVEAAVIIAEAAVAIIVAALLSPTEVVEVSETEYG